MDLAQLQALAAAIDEGSFDAAATALHLTPSAVSQRIKALESSVGSVLVRRSKPTEVTDAGRAYLRLARQVDLLVSEAQADAAITTVPLAISADALATWVLPALVHLPRGVTVDIRREDQDHSAELLRAGTVMAAITTDAEPVQGCTSRRLGVMRYHPMASRPFAREWFRDGATIAELDLAPMVVFDRKDDLQDVYLRSRSSRLIDPPRHHVPGSVEFARAVRFGLGWGLLPEQQSAEWGDGVVAFDEDRHVDVVLYWQQWALQTPSLDAVASVIRDAADVALT
jgi:LysR family transcriptional regulator (chromosome initiation inhibitor)